MNKQYKSICTVINKEKSSDISMKSRNFDWYFAISTYTHFYEVTLLMNIEIYKSLKTCQRFLDILPKCCCEL